MEKRIDIKCETINNTIAKFESSEGTKERVLNKFFSNTCNKNLDDVLVKVTLLNAFYSTQLYNNPATNSQKKHHADILSMAQHIANKQPDFDKWLYSDNWKDNLKAVDYIAFGDSEWVKRNDPKEKNAINDALSFATKYCNWHCPDKYPIVDAIAKGMIYYLCKDKQSSLYESLYDKNLIQKDLNDYKRFCEKFNSFRELVSERDNREYSVKDIDKYLWQYGKDQEQRGVKIAI